jgi:16S rRNA (guanine966-N2)-methyltransferase
VGEFGVRIVAGKWRGRTLSAPRGRDTRPTSDRVREAIFSSVFSASGQLDGRAVADLYAGSGALGLEALSRGASHCVFVESDARAAAVISSNACELGAEPTAFTVVRSPVGRFAQRPPEGRAVSLLLADPPYRIEPSEVGRVFEALAAQGFLTSGALVVYEHAEGTAAVWPVGFVPGVQRGYGGTVVSFATYEG